MRKKLKSRLGFTLTETLIAVALLAFVSAAGAVVSGVVISVRNGMIQTADSRILGSTILQTMADEVRFGKNFADDGSGNITSFNSLKFGEDAAFSVVAQKDIDDTADAAEKAELEKHKGHIQVKSGSSRYYLLTEDAYSHLKVEKDSFKMTEDSSGNIKIELTIENNSDDELWSGSVTVTPLNT